MQGTQSPDRGFGGVLPNPLLLTLTLLPSHGKSKGVQGAKPHDGGLGVSPNYPFYSILPSHVWEGSGVGVLGD